MVKNKIVTSDEDFNKLFKSLENSGKIKIKSDAKNTASDPKLNVKEATSKTTEDFEKEYSIGKYLEKKRKKNPLPKQKLKLQSPYSIFRR
ncbi:MAG: hypothetical protein LBI55_01255 [Oscillospiraceae bacterium]|nr:hypothetical protein [Oscillospiraceae bacterium]